jgi:spore germination cell wall hydrolase CwlJ-like protein
MNQTPADLLKAYADGIVLLTLWREARNQPIHAIKAVYWVIKNRTRDQRYPKLEINVVLQRRQFSCHNPGDPNAVKLALWDDPSLVKCAEAMADPGPDPTGGATHYHSYKEGDEGWPKWGTENRKTAKIGAFHFYKLKPGE